MGPRLCNLAAQFGPPSVISPLAPLILGVVVGSAVQGVCLESSAQRDAVARLQQQADRIGLSLSVRPSCETSSELHARLEVRGDELILSMRAPHGGVASRPLPWTADATDGVTILDARGRLSALALLLAGLAADVQLLTPQQAPPVPAQPLRAEVGRPSRRTPQQHRRSVRRDALSKRRDDSRSESVAPYDQERTAAVPPSTSPTASNLPRTTDGMRRPAASASREGGPGEDITSHDQVPTAAPPFASGTGASRRSSEVAIEGASAPEVAPPPLPTSIAMTAPATATAAIAPARDGGATNEGSVDERPLPSNLEPAQVREQTAASSWGALSRFELIGTARWRSPSIIAQQLAVRGRAGPMFAELDLQLPAQWTLEGRRVDVRAAGARAGVLQAFVSHPLWSLHGLLAAGGQRLEVRRLDVSGARAHAFWDLELSAGIGAERSPGSQVRLGAAVEFVWAPTAHKVVIPEGPSARLNAFGARAGLSVSWGPESGSDQTAAVTTDPQEDGRHEPPARL